MMEFQEKNVDGEGCKVAHEVQHVERADVDAPDHVACGAAGLQQFGCCADERNDRCPSDAYTDGSLVVPNVHEQDVGRGPKSVGQAEDHKFAHGAASLQEFGRRCAKVVQPRPPLPYKSVVEGLAAEDDVDEAADGQQAAGGP